MVARVEDGKLVKEGKQIIVGGNNMYVSLCRKHYNDGRISDDEKYYGYTKQNVEQNLENRGNAENVIVKLCDHDSCV